jgi:putative oxidoreductase
MAAVAGVLLFFGLWTPVAGTAIAIVEVWIFVARSGDPLIAILLVSLGATLAMIGPGVWSIDAQLYGRKHIEPSRQ